MGQIIVRGFVAALIGYALLSGAAMFIFPPLDDSLKFGTSVPVWGLVAAALLIGLLEGLQTHRRRRKSTDLERS